MKVLKEKFLKEEDLQDMQIDEFSPEEDTQYIDDTNIQEPTKTIWRVDFKLGNHENWSRYESETKEEAEQAVTDYITKKWPDREFEIVEVDEFKEEDLEEQLNESLNESETIDAQPIEVGAAVGMASVICDLIKDEYEAIDGYNAAIATAQVEGFEDAARVLAEIQAEENIHVGQLQEIMKLFDPNAGKVEDGQAEGAEQLANPITTDIEELNTHIDEDIEPEQMSRADAEAFDKAVREKWDMSPLEFMQEYNAGRLPMVAVNGYEDIPNHENAIELDSTDISQGTGNVIIYTYMEPETGKLYKYASY